MTSCWFYAGSAQKHRSICEKIDSSMVTKGGQIHVRRCGNTSLLLLAPP